MEVTLRKRSNNSPIKAIIERIDENDYSVISRSDLYLFDWKLERYNEVYKLILKSSREEVLGLMSVVDYPDEKRVDINLLEVRKDHTGKNKKIDGIAGCLISFAIQIGFEKGYNGFVTLEPKKELHNHYQSKYGFIDAGYLVFIDGQAAIDLMNKYL